MVLMSRYTSRGMRRPIFQVFRWNWKQFRLAVHPGPEKEGRTKISLRTRVDIFNSAPTRLLPGTSLKEVLLSVSVSLSLSRSLSVLCVCVCVCVCGRGRLKLMVA